MIFSFIFSFLKSFLLWVSYTSQNSICLPLKHVDKLSFIFKFFFLICSCQEFRRIDEKVEVRCRKSKITLSRISWWFCWQKQCLRRIRKRGPTFVGGVSDSRGQDVSPFHLRFYWKWNGKNSIWLWNAVQVKGRYVLCWFSFKNVYRKVFFIFVTSNYPSNVWFWFGWSYSKSNGYCVY